MEIRQGTDEALLTAICAEPRTLVFLSVPGSGPECLDCQNLFRATTRLSELVLGIEFFLAYEEAEPCQPWLSSLTAVRPRMPARGGPCAVARAGARGNCPRLSRIATHPPRHRKSRQRHSYGTAMSRDVIRGVMV